MQRPPRERSRRNVYRNGQIRSSVFDVVKFDDERMPWPSKADPYDLIHHASPTEDFSGRPIKWTQKFLTD